MKTQHTCFDIVVLFMQLELRYSELIYYYYPAVIVIKNNVDFNEPVMCKADNSYISFCIPCRVTTS